MNKIGIDPRTELRQITRKDALPIAAIVLENYDHLHRWLPWVNEHYSVEVTKRFVGEVDKGFAEGTSFQSVILRDGSIAGVLGFNTISEANKAAEIGYWLSKEYEGTGLMTRSCRALIDFGFKEYSMNRIMIRCASENARSQAIPKRLGFTFEGILREAEKLHGKYVDLVVFSLLRSEWNER